MNYYSRPCWLLRQTERLFYPRCCPFCRQVLGTLPRCPTCNAKLEVLLRKPTFRLNEAQHILFDLDGAAAPYRYSGLVRRGILRAKYQNAPWAAVELGTEMAHLLFGSEIVMRGSEPTPLPVDGYSHGYQFIIPVPSSNKQRGYNVPERMAQPIAQALGVPLRTDLLLRTRTGSKQQGLSLDERLSNVANAFQAVHPEKLENKRILLIDDVITTGATVSACTRALLLAGAESVYAMAFAAVESDSPTLPSQPSAEDNANPSIWEDFDDEFDAI